jgi:dihydrofolate reductase
VRNVVLYTLMSLDGPVDEPGQYFSLERQGTPVFDALMDENESEVIAAQDAVLPGRRRYDEWSGYWPSVHDHPFGDFINRVTKYVVTSTPLTRQRDKSEAVEGPVQDFVRDLEARPGGDIGSPGRRLFPRGDESRRLEVISATPTPSGSVLLAYCVPSMPDESTGGRTS